MKVIFVMGGHWHYFGSLGGKLPQYVVYDGHW
jgi:hypothetical protein